MKEKIFFRIILTSFFCILPIIVILMINHLSLADTLSKMGGDSFGNSYTAFSTSGIVVKDLVQELNKKNISYAIYSDQQEEDTSVIRNIYFNKKYVNLPMLSGRFFSASDFDSGKVAIVGKNQCEKIFAQDGKEYISVDDVNYSVIGIYGYDQETIFDNYIFLNRLNQSDTEKKVYILDCFSKVDAEGVLSEYSRKYGESDFNILGAGTSDYFESITPKIYASVWFFVIMISCLLALIILSIQWFASQQKEMFIRRLFGAQRVNIVGVLLKRYLYFYCPSVIVGFIYCLLFYPAYWRFLLLGCFVSLMCIVLVFIIVISVFMKGNIEEAVK